MYVTTIRITPTDLTDLTVTITHEGDSTETLYLEDFNLVDEALQASLRYTTTSDVVVITSSGYITKTLTIDSMVSSGLIKLIKEKPDKPNGEWTLRDTIYGVDGSLSSMTELEYKQGRNMTGEPETLLGSVPNVHKEDWLFSYLTKHLIYIEQMLDYLDERISEVDNA